MSQANNGQYEEMVQNHVCWNFLLIPVPSLNKAPTRNVGSTLDVLGPYTYSKQQIVLEIKKKLKKNACDCQH